MTALVGATRSPLRSPVRSVFKNALADQFATVNPIAWVDPAISTKYQARTGTGALSGSGDLVGNAENKGSAVANLIANNDSDRPTLDIASGVTSFLYDGSDDRMSLDFDGGVGPSDCAVVMAVKTTDTSAVFVGNNGDGGNKYVFIMSDGSGSAGEGSGIGASVEIYVDGVHLPSPTRDDLHTAIADGAWHIIEAHNVDMSGWPVTGQSNYGTGFRFSGNIGPWSIIPMSSFTENNRQNIVFPYMNAAVGL